MDKIQVKLNFMLVGKTAEAVRDLNKTIDGSLDNSQVLEQVKSDVRFHFGDRGMSVHREKSLIAGKYPEFYAAGWFVSPGTLSDLIVIAHGETMKNAQDLVMHAISQTDWGTLSSEIG